MRLHIVHDTHYLYSSPVLLSQQLLHLTPRELPWQTCNAHRIGVEPTAASANVIVCAAATTGNPSTSAAAMKSSGKWIVIGYLMMLR